MYFIEKIKTEKKGKRWLTGRPTPSCFNPRVMCGMLWGFNFFNRLKISIYPTQKCKLCGFKSTDLTRFTISNFETHNHCPTWWRPTYVVAILQGSQMCINDTCSADLCLLDEEIGPSVAINFTIPLSALSENENDKEQSHAWFEGHNVTWIVLFFARCCVLPLKMNGEKQR